MNKCNKIRLDWIDRVKGVAIFLVVLGHIIIGSYGNHVMNMEKTSPYLIYFNMIYAFHMPLFFMISGYLYPRSLMNLFDCYAQIIKRINVLIVPYVFWGLFNLYIKGSWSSYWFLWTLFEFFIFNLPYIYLRTKNHLSVYYDLVYYSLIYVTFRILSEFDCLSELNNLLDLERFLYNYPAFCFGILLGKNSFWSEFFLAKRQASLAFLIFILLFALQLYNYNIPGIGFFVEKAKGISASIFVIFLCREVFNTGYICDYFTKIGKYTLEIYILHVLIVVNSSLIGDLFYKAICMDEKSVLMNVNLHLVISIVFSVVTIFINMFIARIIHQCVPLSRLTLGR